MKITVKKTEIGGLLPAGDHLTNITEASMDLSKSIGEGLWSDPTPQLKVVAKNKHGMTIAWLNLKGFKNAKDFPDGNAPAGFEFRSFDEESEQFLVNSKTNTRVESAERTEKLLEQVGNLAFAAGFTDDDGDLELEEIVAGLVGQPIIVRIRENKKGKTEVFHFVKPTEVSVEAEM